MKAVFDTNVLVAAFAADGLCAKLLRRANAHEFQLFACPHLIGEFKKALRDKLDASGTEIAEALELLGGVAKIAEPPDPTKRPRACRDRDDDFVLACAVASRVDYLVSGDKDLLILKEHEGIRIVSPRDFELLFR
ncbi:MAG: putative toxin-antitoxin system toxin component, PIN family [Candidatus Aminicenantales bacterium]